MPWNFMQVELVPADRLIRPMIGPGGLTRDQAVAEVQSILDRAAAADPGMAPVAAMWRRGARDDTAYTGPFAWTVYEYPAGQDPRAAAREWLDGYAQTIRSAAGIDVSVATMPDPG